MSHFGSYHRPFYQKLHFRKMARRFVYRVRAGSPGVTAASAPDGPKYPSPREGLPVPRLLYCPH